MADLSPQDYCRHCGAIGNLEESEQIFKDGTAHRRVDCNGCGKFNKYLSQSTGTDICIVRDLKVPMDGALLEDLLKPFLKGMTGLPGNSKVTVIAKVRRKAVRAMSPGELK